MSGVNPRLGLVPFGYCDIFNKIISQPCLSGKVVPTPRLAAVWCFPIRQRFHITLGDRAVIDLKVFG
jgi:hypothetical protein